MPNRCKLPHVFLFGFLLVLILYGGVDSGGVNFAAPESNKNLLQYTILGASMEPTLKDGESVGVDTNYYKTHNLSRGDVIAFKFKTQEKPFVKRVIALPGDKLVFGEDGNIYVNGKKLDEPYLLEKDYHFDASKLKILLIPLKQANDTVPQGTVLVLGDNRKSSFDSENYGFVPAEYVVGKVESNNF